MRYFKTHLLVALLILFVFNTQVYALLLDHLSISSNQYSVGDKITKIDDDMVDLDQKLQLYAYITYGNDLVVDDDVNSIGLFVSESDLKGVKWTTSDSKIATVNSKGLVTGKKLGKAKITATYNNQKKNMILKLLEVMA